MTDPRNRGFGAKCDRLLLIRTHAGLSDLVPALLPIAPLTGWRASPQESPRQAYAARLRLEQPDLAAAVAETCGAAPWIVRSSGDEDLAADVNAGGYESLVCESAEALADCIARVALSGADERATRQRALVGKVPNDGPIPCFVQPLLDVDVAATVEPEQAPYLPIEAVEHIEGIVRRLFAVFDMEAIDCEWGIETDCGFVSGTSIVPRDVTAMTGEHIFGFGFASAQTVAGRPIATVVTPAGSSILMRRGEQSRLVRPRQFHLLQARPALPVQALRDVAVLSAAARVILAGQCAQRAATPLLIGTRDRGEFLVAPSLASAWRSYLAMDAAQRAKLSLVMVDEGSAVEHAGIMFRQSGVTCLLTETGRIPPAAAYALFDRTRCFFGSRAVIAAAETESRAILSLPADCFHSFADGPVASQDAPTVERAIAALPLEEEVRSAILDRSLYPAVDCWLADGERVISPSLTGIALRSGHIPPPCDGAGDSEYCALYRQAALIADGSAAGKTPSTKLGPVDPATLPDLRIGVGLLRVAAEGRHLGQDVPPSDPGDAATLATDRIATGDLRGARLILDRFVSFAAAMNELPIYEPDERAGLLAALGYAFRSGADPVDANALDALRLPPIAALQLLSATVDAPTFRDTALHFARAHNAFLAVPPEAAAEAAQMLNTAAAELFACMTGTTALTGIAGLIRGMLIESYDATLKVLLIGLVDGRKSNFIPYLDVMAAWIDWADDGDPTAAEATVLDQFRRWIREARGADIPDDFTIEDRNWRIEFPRVAEEHPEPYENPHVLHNLLHQWMLSRKVVGTSLLPQRLQVLHHFCTTFSMRETKVLRFTADLFEIEIPMGTHKVSFAFTADSIAVEWSEPPDCPDDEIARILAFELFLERFRDWFFDTLTFQREKVIGTWTLQIRIGAPSGGWTFDDYRQAVVALRFLFDSTYDFSYVENDAIEGLAESLTAPTWREITRVLIDFRATFDDTAQYVFLHTVPLSSAVATLSQSVVARGLLRRCHRGGFATTMAIIDALADWLEDGDDAERWSRRYELLRQACLFAAAAWPQAVIDRLARQDEGHAGDELLACCVLRRADMRGPIRTLTAAGERSGGTTWFVQLVLRHVPDLLLTIEAAQAAAKTISVVPAINKRAKQYLIARQPDVLDKVTMDLLIEDLDTLPFSSSGGEERIAMAIEAGKPLLRFDLARGVDWAALDTWFEAARPPEAAAGSAASA